ncbi:MAG: type III pantothenate kinase [Bacteroidetes bacterium]|nr:type III pantothenate kinase [Bacteroidota bacterium]
MNLAVDIGNTRTKIALFEGNALVRKFTWKSWKPSDLFELATNQNVKNIIYSTVAAVSVEEVKGYFNDFFFLPLTAETPLPIDNLYATPETLGKDRLAAVVGAFQLYPSKNCLVVDAGTCITYDILNAQGEYLGGNIAPGISLRLRAMHEFTARLPLIEQGPFEQWIGDSTESAMRNGGQLGVLLEVSGYIRHFKEKFGDVCVIFTGGDSNFFVENLKSKIFVNQNLVLIGLNKILNYNVR